LCVLNYNIDTIATPTTQAN